MNHKRLLGLVVLLLGSIGIALATYRIAYGTKNAMSDSAEAQQIQETIQLSYEIEAQTAHTFDDSLYPSVYTNDSRGGKITGTTLDLVRSVRNDYSLTAESVGFLDYKIAYNTWRKNGALQLEQVWQKARSEGRDYLTEEESKSLMDSSGRVPPQPIPASTTFTINIEFISISVEGEVAKAVFDDGAQTQEMTLVKKEGQWYIAGLKILSSHP